MDFRENKLEWALVIGCLFGVWGLFQLFGSVGNQSPHELPEISYEMPRPKDDLPGEFGLEGREIERRTINPFEKKKVTQKKVDPAKPVAGSSAKPPSPAAQPTYVLRKKASVDVRVVDKDQKPEEGPGARTFNKNNLIGKANNPVQDKDKDKDPADPNTDHLSPAAWRSLLLAQPTRENMDKLLTALAKGEVDRQTFYQIAGDLLKSHRKEEEILALYGANRVGDTGSFALVAKEYDNLPAEVKPSAQQFLMSYTAPSRHLALKSALQVSDASVAVKAAQVVLAGLQGGDQTTTNNPRQVRGEIRGTTATNSYADFAPIFRTWENSGNSTLQNIATNILALLPSSQV